MKKKTSMMIAIIGLLGILTSCVGPSRLEMDYGTSAKLAKYNQILNPEAEKNLEPVTGLDGAAAKANVEKYRKGFEKPQAPPTYTLSIGSIGK